MFTGGFAFIINNGIEKPHYILDTAGNTNINNIVLAELPGWDSYNTNQSVISDTWNTGDEQVFDLGQKVDFALNTITVDVSGSARTAEAGTPAGSNTPNGTTFVPGAYPNSLPSVNASKFQIYTDAATNTTVVYIGGLSDGNVAKVNILSRNPVTVTCGIIQSFGNLLLQVILQKKIDFGYNTKLEVIRVLLRLQMLQFQDLFLITGIHLLWC